MTSKALTLRNRLGRLYRDVCAPWHFYLSRREFQRLLPADFSSQGCWNVIRTYRGAGWFADLSAWQVESEYCDLIEWVAEQKPSVILEIGTAKGATLLAWSRIATELVVSVDLPGGIHGGGYPVLKEKLYREFIEGRPAVEMVILRGDSHSVEIRDVIKAKLNGKTIDFLFIDGDHTYAGVSCDFELWTPLVTPGGHVAFHDILHHGKFKDCQVDRLWSELKQRYTHFEIVADPQQGWAGVGVLQLPRHK